MKHIFSFWNEYKIDRLIPDSTRASRWRKFLEYKTYRTTEHKEAERALFRLRSVLPLALCFCSGASSRARPSHHAMSGDPKPASLLHGVRRALLLVLPGYTTTRTTSATTRTTSATSRTVTSAATRTIGTRTQAALRAPIRIIFRKRKDLYSLVYILKIVFGNMYYFLYFYDFVFLYFSDLRNLENLYIVRKH